MLVPQHTARFGPSIHMEMLYQHCHRPRAAVATTMYRQHTMKAKSLHHWRHPVSVIARYAIIFSESKVKREKTAETILRIVHKQAQNTCALLNDKSEIGKRNVLYGIKQLKIFRCLVNLTELQTNKTHRKQDSCQHLNFNTFHSIPLFDLLLNQQCW